MTWKEAVWQALQRRHAVSALITRAELIEHELAAIKAATGTTGATPDMTLSRVLQELRDDGVVLFDGQGRYRLAAEAARQPLEQAVATEVLALRKARVGQGPFRAALDARWSARCPLTGIGERALLRASHIVPWSECETEAERLNPENGLLLSALWDAAFDRRLVTFADDGVAMPCRGLSAATLGVLKAAGRGRINGLTAGNRERLAWHRGHCAFN